MNVSKMRYHPGNIVWVHLLNRIWWPGRVIGMNRVPKTMELNTSRRIIAIVHFESDDFYEVVYNRAKLSMYTCPRKMEFVKKGFVMYKKQCNGVTVPCNFIMNNFIKAVIDIEREIYGNVHIFEPLEQEYDEKHSRRSREVQDIYALFITEKQRKANLRKQKKKDKLLELKAALYYAKKAAVAAKTTKTKKIKNTKKTANTQPTKNDRKLAVIPKKKPIAPAPPAEIQKKRKYVRKNLPKKPPQKKKQKKNLVDWIIIDDSDSG